MFQEGGQGLSCLCAVHQTFYTIHRICEYVVEFQDVGVHLNNMLDLPSGIAGEGGVAVAPWGWGRGLPSSSFTAGLSLTSTISPSALLDVTL